MVRARPDDYYAYLPCSPNGEPFCAGKGEQEGLFHHEPDAQQHPDWHSHKRNLIRTSRNRGEAVSCRTQWMADEAAALAAGAILNRLMLTDGARILRTMVLVESDGGAIPLVVEYRCRQVHSQVRAGYPERGI